jgi:acetolactate synthase I/II/III large subunit
LKEGHVSTPADRRGTPEYGSDLVVDLLLEMGIEYAALSPGSSFRGLHDSLVNYGGNRPQIIECTHEEISVAIAHGYAKSCGKPMAAFMHDVVGLQHATMAIYNAWCDRVPVIVIGGTGPMDATHRRPWVDWVHTANLQGNLVRDYTKFDEQPSSVAMFPESVVHAVRLATTPPCAPVYLCFDLDLQEQALDPAMARLPAARVAQPTLLAPDPAAVEQVAEWLVNAESPVIATGRLGFRQAHVDAAVQLAELLAIPVLDATAVSMNFPSTHPLNLTGADKEVLAGADVVIGLESRDLFGTLNSVEEPSGRIKPIAPTDAKVVNVTLDMFVTGSWSTDFQRVQPSDLTIPADVGLFVQALIPACRARLDKTPSAKGRIEHRRARLAETSAALRAGWLDRARSALGESPLSLAGLALTVWEGVKDRDWVLANGQVNGWVHRLWEFERANQWIGSSGGGGLGYGMGATIGAALAHRGSDRIIVDIQSDGDGLMTPGALWTMVQYDLPILVILKNNHTYENSEVHAERVARHRQRPIENKTVGITIPGVDWATMARGYGMRTEGPITTAAELRPAIDRALETISRERRPVLLDVMTGLR